MPVAADDFEEVVLGDIVADLPHGGVCPEISDRLAVHAVVAKEPRVDLELEEVRDEADVGAGDDEGGREEGEVLQQVVPGQGNKDSFGRTGQAILYMVTLVVLQQTTVDLNLIVALLGQDEFWQNWHSRLVKSIRFTLSCSRDMDASLHKGGSG